MDSISEILRDFSILALLYLVGFFLRKHIKFLQNCYIPASLLGGFIGLLLGPQVLGSVSPIYLPIPDSIAGLAGVLICVIMGVSFLGVERAPSGKTAVATTVTSAATYQAQLLIGLVVAFLVGSQFDLPMAFGFTGIYGFYSGHGTAAATGSAFIEQGWADGLSVATTVATVGLMSGIICGIILINWGVRKGFAQVVDKPAEMPPEVKCGYVPVSKRKSIGMGVSYPDVLDPLALQVGFCLLTYGGGLVIRNALIAIWAPFKEIPLFAVCLLMGVVINKIMFATKRGDYLDRATITRISGFLLEIMICSAVATTSIEVFTTYLFPLVVLSIGLILVSILMCFFVGYKVLKTDWFESAVAIYGTYSGVLATGLLLVKTIDPDNKTSGAINATAAAAISNAWMLPYIALGPALSFRLPPLLMIGVTAVAFIAIMIILRIGFWNKDRRISDWFRKSASTK